MIFSVITKNFKGNIVTKNLVTLKDRMGLMMKNFDMKEVH